MKALLTAVTLSCVLAQFCEAQRTVSIDRNSYGAVAVSESVGKYGYAYNFRSRKAAEKEALKNCDAPDAKIACWVNNGFIALGRSNEKSCWGAGWVYGASVKARDAIKMSLDNVNKFCTNPSGAYVAIVLSSDGQFILEQRDKNSFVDQDGKAYQGSIAEPKVTTTVTTKDGKVFKYDEDGHLIESSESPNSTAVVTKDGKVFKFEADGQLIESSPAPSSSKGASNLGRGSAEEGKP